MLAAYCSTARTIELRDIATPQPGAGEAIIKVRSCGICGSDLHFYSGNFPAPPVCPGHEISGEVAEVGAGVTTVKPGDRVAVEPLMVCRECRFCRTGNYQLCRQMRVLGNMVDGGFAEYVRVPDYSLFTLPKTLDFEVGALTEPLAVGVHGVRLGGVRLGDRVLVQGAGTIGLLTAAAARAAGAGEIWIAARHPHQAAAAKALGATRVFTGPDMSNALSTASDDAQPDLVIETVGGSADTINEALQVVRRGGTIVVLGIFTSFPQINPIALVIKEARIVGSMVYGRTPANADFNVASHILSGDPERFRQLITHRVALSEIASGFETAADKKSGAIKVAVRA
ncbi:MAG TPA: alcohol dehydrogenase catalytic domain-containing protein [Candidatus Acidoferrales bacterium]|nr:alcohol dehydrogenase catalytic domain-containing protein [Candidatus Acidoferrales bacterium]